MFFSRGDTLFRGRGYGSGNTSASPFRAPLFSPLHGVPYNTFVVQWFSSFPAAYLIATVSMACSGAGARLDSSRERPPARDAIASVLDTARPERRYIRAAQLRRLRRMLVQWKRGVVGEKDYGGATRAGRANIKSESKSVISALAGIAIGRERFET
ncbi:MAG: hypothetical protein ABIR58_04170 [Gemmatimonadaceae bacterium]